MPGRSADADSELGGLLSLLQLSDSAFPSGRYTLSHGLETQVRSGRLRMPSDPTRQACLLRDQVRLSVGPSDGVALACAHRASSDPEALDLGLAIRADARLSAVKLSREARETSTRTGRALLRVATSAMPAAPVMDFAREVTNRRSPGNHAVVLGVLSASLGVPCRDAVAGELFAFAASWVAAAVRLAVTDHVTAQAVLHDVRPHLVAAATRAADGDVPDITSSTPLLDVMAMRHEESELRLFAS